ncbi:MAG: class I SAM-dependent methyltransferase [Deltaproteobacteria bacterium]|jgi:SAM-dependent methyltransferase|nr:class I SAM-dependent methyltransferase [Deltaproteobacteria bacterium]
MHATYEPFFHTGKTIAEYGEYTVIQCESCGFAHCLPIPEYTDLKSIYQKDYYTKIKPDYIERAEKDRAWHEMIHNHRLKVIEGLTPGRNLLEVGSGPGLFLNCARQRGWQTLGFEPSKEAWLYSREILHLNVKNEFFGADDSDALPKFDAICLSLVLEHIRDPQEMMNHVKAHLMPGGVVCIVVPNDFNDLQTILCAEKERHKWWVAPPHHINYFTHASLAGFLQRSGLKVVKQETTFPLELFLLLGFDYTADDLLGRKCHDLRMQFEQKLEQLGLGTLQCDLYDVFLKHGLGRHAVAYAVL